MRRVLLSLNLFVWLGLLALVVPSLRTATAKPAQTRVALVVPSSVSAPGAGGTAAFDRDFPDPTVITAGRMYYAFATHTPWEVPGHVFPILESRDLKSWSYAADVFSAPPAWGRGDWWAPAVVARGGTYFLYYSGMSPSGLHCLAVASAMMPAGPYTDHGPIACQDGTAAMGYIDAWPLIAEGHAYLYFSVDGPTHHSVSVLPLRDDMLGVAGPRVELFGVSRPWEAAGTATVEGPSVFAWGSRYVLLYSGGSWRGDTYAMGYAIGTSPLGPFVKGEAPFLRSGGSLVGPGGGSFFRDLAGRPWLAYHAWSGDGRVLNLTPLTIR